jgi:hypothetical protein
LKQPDAIPAATMQIDAVDAYIRAHQLYQV